MLKPVFTEKSLKLSKLGMYTFWVSANDTKPKLKAALAKLFGVHVIAVKTLKKAGETGRTARGRKVNKLALKKAIFTLKEGEKLDIFEETKSK